MEGKMSEQFTGCEVHSIKGTRIARPQPSSIRFAKLLLTGLAAMLLLGIESAFAICVCGDGLCNRPSPAGGTCIPPESPQTCPADCPSPAELTLRVTVVPFGDPGRFNLEIDRGRVATNVGNGATTGPLTVVSGAHTVTETAGTGTGLADYRTTICGACAVGGTIQLGAGQTRSCSFTNLRPTPPLAPGQISPARRLSIARYTRPNLPSVGLTEADADRILAEMSDVLRALNLSGDVACNVAYCRNSNIGAYAVGDGIIDTEDELDDVLAVPQSGKGNRFL
jgi:hypothetical protein